MDSQSEIARAKEQKMSESTKQTAKFPERVSEQRRTVVEQMLKDMSENEFTWIRDWALNCSPINAVTGTRYRGGNRLHLAAIARIRGYRDPRWMTFNQAKKNGWKVRKGAKSAVVEKWKAFSYDKKETDAATGEETVRRVSYVRCVGYWSVFNAEDVEGIPAYEEPKMNCDDPSSYAALLADDFIATSRCEIREGGTDCACYIPALDRIEVPARGQFTCNEAFLRTLLHEMGHSTKVPLGRERSKDMVDYAFEELVAELCALFAAADAGLDCANFSSEEGSDFYRNHVAYIQSWSKRLASDPDALFKAATKASAAADYLNERRVSGASESVAVREGKAA